MEGEGDEHQMEPYDHLWKQGRSTFYFNSCLAHPPSVAYFVWQAGVHELYKSVLKE